MHLVFFRTICQWDIITIRCYAESENVKRFKYCTKRRVGSIVLNATFNNILAISWRSGLLMEETGVPGENHRPAESHLQNLSHSVVYIE
jgi:hypothetical protein